jgi:hypothetical protein
MGLTRRRFYIDTGCFVTTGQTGAFGVGDTGCFVITGNTGCFITIDQLSGDGSGSGVSIICCGTFDLSGARAFGSFPSTGAEGSQFAFSNSHYISGEDQFSYFVCSVYTTGLCYSPCLPYNTSHVELPSDYSNQAWMVTTNIVGVGQNITGGCCEYYGGEIKSLVKGDSSGNYCLCTAYNCVYARTNTGLNVCLTTLCEVGIQYSVHSSDPSIMKWTSKTEVLQNIYDVNMEFTELTAQSYITGQGTGSAFNVYPETSQPNVNTIVLDAETAGEDYIVLDGGEDNG